MEKDLEYYLTEIKTNKEEQDVSYEDLKKAFIEVYTALERELGVFKDSLAYEVAKKLNIKK